jgi:hypothetical protein
MHRYINNKYNEFLPAKWGNYLYAGFLSIKDLSWNERYRVNAIPWNEKTFFSGNNEFLHNIDSIRAVLRGHIQNNANEFLFPVHAVL